MTATMMGFKLQQCSRQEGEGARTSQLVSDIVNVLHLVVDHETVSQPIQTVKRVRNGDRRRIFSAVARSLARQPPSNAFELKASRRRLPNQSNSVGRKTQITHV